MSDDADSEADLDAVARRVEVTIRQNRAVLNEVTRDDPPANSVVGRLARSVL